MSSSEMCQTVLPLNFFCSTSEFRFWMQADKLPSRDALISEVTINSGSRALSCQCKLFPRGRLSPHSAVRMPRDETLKSWLTCLTMFLWRPELEVVDPNLRETRKWHAGGYRSSRKSELLDVRSLAEVALKCLRSLSPTAPCKERQE